MHPTPPQDQTLLTAQQVREITGLTKQRLSQLRVGWWRKLPGGNGPARRAWVEPVLGKGTHWWYLNGGAVYSEEAVAIIRERQKSGK